MQLPQNPLPDFGFYPEMPENDEEGAPCYHAAIVVGRAVAEEAFRSPKHVRAVAAAVRKWAVRTGLPLALVFMGTTINWEDDEDEEEELDEDEDESDEDSDDDREDEDEDEDDDGDFEGADAIVGLVTAYASEADGYKPLDRAALDLSLGDRIPEEFWDDLSERLRLELGREEENGEDVGTALFFAPAGWTVASIVGPANAEDERPTVVTTSSEDTYVGVVLTRKTHPELWSGTAPLFLNATYA